MRESQAMLNAKVRLAISVKDGPWTIDLIRMGAQIGEQELMLGIQSGETRIVQMLLRHGAKVRPAAIKEVLRCGTQELIELAQEWIKQLGSIQEHAVLDEAAYRLIIEPHKKSLSIEVMQSADPQSKDKALDRACEKGWNDSIMEWLKLGAKPSLTAIEAALQVGKSMRHKHQKTEQWEQTCVSLIQAGAPRATRAFTQNKDQFCWKEDSESHLRHLMRALGALGWKQMAQEISQWEASSPEWEKLIHDRRKDFPELAEQAELKRCARPSETARTRATSRI